MGVLNENIATSWKLFVPYLSPYLRLGGKLHQGWHFFLPNQCNPIQESKSRKALTFFPLMVTAILLLTLVHQRRRASLLSFPLRRGFGKSLPSVFTRITIPPKCFLDYLRLLLFGAHFSHGSFWFGRIFFRNGLSFVIQSTNGESNNKEETTLESTSALTYREKREDAHCRASMSGAFDWLPSFDSSNLIRRS